MQSKLSALLALAALSACSSSSNDPSDRAPVARTSAGVLQCGLSCPDTYYISARVCFSSCGPGCGAGEYSNAVYCDKLPDPPASYQTCEAEACPDGYYMQSLFCTKACGIGGTAVEGGTCSCCAEGAANTARCVPVPDPPTPLAACGDCPDGFYATMRSFSRTCGGVYAPTVTNMASCIPIPDPPASITACATECPAGFFTTRRFCSGSCGGLCVGGLVNAVTCMSAP